MKTESTNLPNKFVFWYRISKETIAEDPSQKHSIGEKEYEDQVKKLAEFDTLENFWKIFQFLKKPQECKVGTEFQLFKDNVKPLWEDEKNKNGGRLGIKLRKEFTNLVWEEVVFGLIGGELEKEAKDEVNGIVISCKKDFNSLQIWFKNYEEKVYKNLEKTIREMLEIPSEVAIENKPFQQSDKGYNNNFQRRQGGGNYYQKNNNYKNYNNKGYNNRNTNTANNNEKNKQGEEEKEKPKEKEKENEKEEPKKEPKKEPKEEPKEETKEEVKEERKEERKEEIKEEIKETKTEEGKGQSHKKKRKKDKKEAPVEEPKETPKEENETENGEDFKEIKKKKKVKKKE